MPGGAGVGSSRAPAGGIVRLAPVSASKITNLEVSNASSIV